MRNYFNIVEEWKEKADAKVMKPTESWMSAKFDALNAEFFSGELPKPHFEVKPLDSKTMGHFSFGKKFAYSRMSRMPVDGNRDLTVYDPTITMNAGIAHTEHNLEHVLLHEMVHWYVDWKYVGMGYGFPKQGHGREFVQVCQRIRSESNGNFDIKRSISLSKENYVMDDSLLNASERRKEFERNRKCDVIWIKYKDGKEGFVLTYPKSTGHVMLDIEDHNFMSNNIEWIKYCDDHVLGTALRRMTKFALSNKYTGFYNMAKYPEESQLIRDDESKFKLYNLQVKENCVMEQKKQNDNPIVEDDGDVNTIPAGAPIHED